MKLAERLLRELAFPSIDHAFLTRVLDYLDHLPAPERTALVSHLGQTPLVVTTAHPLDAPGRGGMARTTRDSESETQQE